MIVLRTKDPAEVVDYPVDWTSRLVTDTIDTSTWEVVELDDLVVENDDKTGTSTTVWVSGGLDGVTYILKNTVETTGGRTLVESFHLSVAAKL